MSNAEDRRKRARQELTSLDAAFEPEPVAPEEARRRDLSATGGSPRDIVELTSPIGHRLRVPPSPATSDPEPAPQPNTVTKPKS